MAHLTDYEYDIFLSHNHADQEWTTKLAERLEQEDWQGRKLKVFFSPWDIRPGQSIPQRIEQALPKSRKVGLVLSPDAMKSAWVELERLVTTYIAVSARDERLIPLYRRECEIPALLLPVLYIDFRDDERFEDSFRMLLAIIRDEPLPRQSRAEPGRHIHFQPSAIPRSPIVGFVSRSDRDGRNFLELLREELAPRRAQLVALWGAGGVGKTTLAAETARSLVDDFAHRAVWVSADTRSDLPFSTFLDEVATQLGADELRKLAPEAKSAAVRNLVISQPTLIVLDNFETISTGERQHCLEFLEHVQCSALVTTRQKLDHARSVPITGMSVNEANDFLQMLVDQTQDPEIFAAAYRERLIVTAEFNPLLMEWIVGQIDLANDPDEVFNDLARGEGDAAHRVFDRSYNLPQLNEGGRAVLLALALFTPSAGRPTLAAVAGMDLGKKRDKVRFKQAQETLASLWLIRKMEGGLRLAVSGLTRELTKAKLASDLRAKTIPKRFVSKFIRYVEVHQNRNRQDYDALENEKDNLLTASDIATTLDDWSDVCELAYSLAQPNEGILVVRGYWDEALRIGMQALRIARASKVEREIASWSNNVALLYHDRGELSQAKKLHDEGLTIARNRGDQIGTAISLHNLGMITHRVGDLNEAHHLFEESLELEKKQGDQIGIARTLNHLAMLAHDEGKLNEARSLYEESIAIKRDFGALETSITASIYGLGRIEQAQGNLDDADRLYTECLEVGKKLGDQSEIAISLNALGSVAYDRKDFDRARKMFEDSIGILKAIGKRDGIAVVLHQLGKLESDRGSYQIAERLFSDGLQIVKDIGDRLDLAEFLESLGNLKTSQGNLQEAQALLEEGLALATEIRIPFRIASIKHSLGLLREKRDEKVEAIHLLNEALPVLESLRSPRAKDARRDLKRIEGKYS